jgi:hypothetical protein
MSASRLEFRHLEYAAILLLQGPHVTGLGGATRIICTSYVSTIQMYDPSSINTCIYSTYVNLV